MMKRGLASTLSFAALSLVSALDVQTAFAEPTGANLRSDTFVDAATVVPGLIAEIRYAGPHNFVGRPIDGYQAPHCLLTSAAANALVEVARDVASHGLVVKVFDCY